MHCCVAVLVQLMDGRKTVGGKLEVKLRMRNPLVSRQVEEVHEKWLVIDRFERKLPSSQVSACACERLLRAGADIKLINSFICMSYLALKKCFSKKL